MPTAVNGTWLVYVCTIPCWRCFVWNEEVGCVRDCEMQQIVCTMPLLSRMNAMYVHAEGGILLPGGCQVERKHMVMQTMHDDIKQRMY